MSWIGQPETRASRTERPVPLPALARGCRRGLRSYQRPEPGVGVPVAEAEHEDQEEEVEVRVPGGQWHQDPLMTRTPKAVRTTV